VIDTSLKKNITSPLMQEIRVNRGLSYGARSNFERL